MGSDFGPARCVHRPGLPKHRVMGWMAGDHDLLPDDTLFDELIPKRLAHDGEVSGLSATVAVHQVELEAERTQQRPIAGGLQRAKEMPWCARPCVRWRLAVLDGAQ